MVEVMTQNNVKSSSVDSGSVKKDKVMVQDIATKVPKKSQQLAASETVRKDSVKVNISLSFLSF